MSMRHSRPPPLPSPPWAASVSAMSGVSLESPILKETLRLRIVARKMFLAVILATGCAHLPPGALGVPVVEQATDYSCGPATLMAVLRYWQRPVACEQDLYPALHTTP